MEKKLFVGTLPFEWEESDVEEVFSAVGKVVSVKLILDRDNNNKKKGFGFVEMATAEDAKHAIEKLNGSKQGNKGMNIVVSEAKPPVKRENGRYGDKPAGGGYRDSGNRSGGEFRNRSERNSPSGRSFSDNRGGGGHHGND